MTPTEKLNAEISLQKARLAGLEQALAIISDDDDDEAPAPKQLPAPKKSSKKDKQPPESVEETIEINGTDLVLTAKETEVIKMFIDAEGEVVKATDLANLFNGRIQGFYNAATELKPKLSAVGAAFENVRGQGYRLVVVEG